MDEFLASITEQCFGTLLAVCPPCLKMKKRDLSSGTEFHLKNFTEIMIVCVFMANVPSLWLPWICSISRYFSDAFRVAISSPIPLQLFFDFFFLVLHHLVLFSAIYPMFFILDA